MIQHQVYSWVLESDYTAIAGPDWPVWDLFSLGQNVPDFVYKEIDQMLKANTSFGNRAFCVLPFYGREYPDDTACCLLPPGANLNEIKSKMLAGERATACNKCWSLEDSGGLSDRMIKNTTLDYYTDISLENLYNNCVAGANKIISYKIDTNNTCNSTCVTCNSQSSSAWAQLERRNNVTPHRTWRIESDKTHSWIDFENAKTILFRGGEPFLSDTNFYILEQLLEHNNSDCFISFVTNGSVKLSADQKKVLDKFSRKNFCFSIDGIGSVFEYMRYPLVWEDIVSNIEFCRSSNIDVSVSYTLSNLNVLYHNQTSAWFRDNKIPYLLNPVTSPSYFSPTALPETTKQSIASTITDRSVVDILMKKSPGDNFQFELFKKEIAKQDQWKNISITDYLPEFAAILQG